MLTRYVVALGLVAACSSRPGTGSARLDPSSSSSSGSSTTGSSTTGTTASNGTGADTATTGTSVATATDSASPASSASLPLPGVSSVKVTLADVGLEASSLDRTADPCVDFYQFACGGWMQNHPIPADRAGVSRFSEVQERNLAALRDLLEDAAKGIGADPATKKLGDYYASCMDEAAIEQAGPAALRPLLAKVSKVNDARAWLAAVIELHRLGRWVVWRARVEADLKASATNVIYLDPAGLGLPDRDYYMKPELAPRIEGYRAHVARMLALAGTPAARVEAAASDVVAIELALAKLTKTRTERRDLTAMYNPIDAAALAKQVKSVDWKAYWKGLGAEPSKKLIVGTPAFFAQLDALRASFKPAQWASYFTYHLVHRLAFALPKAFDTEAFQREKLVSGIEQPQDRARRCVLGARVALGELLGARYVAQHVPASLREIASRLMDALVEVMHGELGKLDWMTDATRRLAQDKLSRIVRMTGYPDRWRSYDFEVKRNDFLGNTARAAAFETRRELGNAGKPVDRAEWRLQAYDVDAYYEPTSNSTVLPAGILQPPFFGQDRAVAANLGGIGTVIGHELTHGFDDQGARFDATGNLASWWAPEDSKRFEERGACLANMYSTFEAMPGGYVNGRLTLGENIADLGGVKMAHAAYRLLRRDAAKVYVADGFTEDQQFFLGFGQVWCTRQRPAEVERRLIGDEHAPNKFRVYGSLRNLRAFAEAFSCAPGTPMNPAKTCSVW